MGTGYHGGFGHTKGNRDYQNATENKIEQENQKREALILELKNSGTKITEKDIVFIDKDTTGQVVWIEVGNRNAGLQHIYSHHEKDFKNAYGVDKTEIPHFILNVIKNGKIISNKKVERNGAIGYERIYEYNDRFVTLIGMGANGFIVTSYPKHKEMKYEEN